ncbi:uncharacterized protein [Fopius arisanus]|uniref:Small ribosomal subunit protein mS38 n=1 Tax=Fopius arisanus TaxID=64838 RepID=A0A9R1TV66_9HYME|nr:PREDICTED: uncharacterized protein LOC105263107 [Fopius arisanus]
MSVNAVGHILRRLKISCGGTSALRYSTSCGPPTAPPPTNYMALPPGLHLSPLPTLRLDLPLSNNWIHRRIIENPLSPSPAINDLPKSIIPISEKAPEESLDLPSQKIIEKEAARLIVIRRRKMRRHKLKKRRKRMKFVWRKFKQKRELRKEKAFQAELLGQIREAEAFDAKSYVDSKLKILDNVRLPSKWRGEVLPEHMIRQFVKEKEHKRWLKRNRPRISLD